MQKLKKLLQNIALLGAVCTVLLLLGEVALRMLLPRPDDALPGATNLGTLQRESTIPGLFWEGNPNFRSPEYTLNAFGFRDTAFQRRKPRGRIRIALLGDSITFGLGVHQPDSIYAARLEKMLQADGAIDVYNFGVPGYNTWQEFVQLQRVVMPYQPDYLLLGFFFNDADGLTEMPTAAGIVSTTPAPDAHKSRRDWLTRLKSSYVVQGAKQVFERAAVALFDDYPNYMDLKIKTDKWRQMQAELLRLKQFAAAQHVPLAVVVFPVSYQLRRPEAASRAQQDVRGFLDRNDFHYLDLFPVFRAYLQAHRFDFKKLLVKGIPDSHPTAAGHAIAARAIRDFLLQDERFLALLDAAGQPARGDAHRP